MSDIHLAHFLHFNATVLNLISLSRLVLACYQKYWRGVGLKRGQIFWCTQVCHVTWPISTWQLQLNNRHSKILLWSHLSPQNRETFLPLKFISFLLNFLSKSNGKTCRSDTYIRVWKVFISLSICWQSTCLLIVKQERPILHLLWYLLFLVSSHCLSCPFHLSLHPPICSFVLSCPPSASGCLLPCLSYIPFIWVNYYVFCYDETVIPSLPCLVQVHRLSSCHPTYQCLCRSACPDESPIDLLWFY